LAQDSTTYPIPPARAFETRYSIIWERKGRWIIRRRADGLRARVSGYGTIVAFVAGIALIPLGIHLDNINIIVVACIAIASVVIGLTNLGMNPSGGPSSVIDWARGTMEIDGLGIALDTIRSIYVDTAMATRYSGGLIPSQKWQVWRMSLEVSDPDAPILIASSCVEDFLLAAANKLAAQLNIPVRQRSKTPDTDWVVPRRGFGWRDD
jgi:hypothetical protein